MRRQRLNSPLHQATIVMQEEEEHDESLEQQQQPPRKRRVRRIRVACVRCRQRKSRCDAATPKCSPCANARVPCVYDDFLPNSRRSLARTELQSSSGADATLRKRIEQLESLLRREAPHVELPAETISFAPPESCAGSSDEAVEDAATHNNASSPAPAHNDPAADALARGNLSHQVGLVSLSAGADPRYVGPSSGYFLTKLLSCPPAKVDRGRAIDGNPSQASRRQQERDLAIGVFRDTTYSLPSEEMVKQVSKTYFETIHLQFPFLHEPTHWRLVEQVFRPNPTKSCLFQVTMVLSISAMILSRRSHVELPAAGWCAAAMEHFPEVQVEGSIQGLQCLLLMLVYAMHSPSSRFNAWYINYQCIAMVLDLGLQRDCSVASMSQFQREMRTRIFWVVYSLDRKLGTMMGRPIGLRDEACDLRLPTRLSDDALGTAAASDNSEVTHIDFAIHFFKLSRIVSEIKYVLHSIRRETPSYAFPAIRDILEWQDAVMSRLDEWHDSIPETADRQLQYGEPLCRIQYFTTRMLLLLPTPGIPTPRPHYLLICYKSSVEALHLFNALYSEEMLVYNWATCHSVILHAFCMLYCATKVPQLSTTISTDTLLTDLRAASNVLSAIGEHWAGAKRTRDLLNNLATNALQRTQQSTAAGTVASNQPNVSKEPNLSTITPDDARFGDTGAQGPSIESLFAEINPYQGVDLISNDFDLGNLFVDTIDFPVSGDGLLGFSDNLNAI